MISSPAPLWLGWHGLQFLHDKEHTQFINDAAHKVSTPIAHELGQGPEDQNVTLKQELGDCFSCLIGGHICHTMFVKWSWNTRTLATLGSWFSSVVVSMLVTFTCKRSNGVVATIGCRSSLGKSPSCCKQCIQNLMDHCIWLIIPSHQKCSCSKDKVWSWPWWPASLWHPFRVVTQWALGTTKSSRSSVLPLGVESRYKAPWWI